MFKGLALNLEEVEKSGHHINLPDPFRILILGASNAGKTTLLLEALLQPNNFISYNNLVIFTKKKNEQSYQFLFHGYSNKLSKEDLGAMWLDQDSLRQYKLPIPILCQLFASQRQKEANLNGDITAHLSDKIAEIPMPEDLDKHYGKRKHTVVFDNCAGINKTMMEIYFTEGRHANINSIYLAHDFFELPKNIRINSNLIILFQQDPEKLSRIFNSCIGERIMEKKRFIAYCNHVWSKPHTYVAINKESGKITDDLFLDVKNE